MGKKTDRPKPVKLAIGTVYQKTDGGSYFFRYQIDGQRKAVSLHTKNQEEAIAEAKKVLPMLEAPSAEVVAAHVKHVRSWGKRSRPLELKKAWAVYDGHPDRARPRTVNIYQRYESYFRDLVVWASERGYGFLHEITDTVASEYADVLRSSSISVDTHNKRMTRISHVFRTLADYTREETSDWTSQNLRRKPDEENSGIEARRLAFTKEEEAEILAVFEDPGRTFKNKAELRVMFYLGAFTGQRMKDCALLQWHRVYLDRQRIDVIQSKTGKKVTIPISPQLLTVLREAEKWQDNDGVEKRRNSTYVLPNVAQRYLSRNKQGKDVGAGLVNKDVMRVIRWAGMEPNKKVTGRKKAVTVYGFHSLRHSFVSFCIDHNIPKAVAVSILGADSDIIDRYYTHIGEEAQEQAIQLISGNGNTMKQRFERAVAFLDGIEEKTEELAELERILRG